MSLTCHLRRRPWTDVWTWTPSGGQFGHVSESHRVASHRIALSLNSATLQFPHVRIAGVQNYNIRFQWSEAFSPLNWKRGLRCMRYCIRRAGTLSTCECLRCPWTFVRFASLTVIEVPLWNSWYVGKARCFFPSGAFSKATLCYFTLPLTRNRLEFIGRPSVLGQSPTTTSNDIQWLYFSWAGRDQGNGVTFASRQLTSKLQKLNSTSNPEHSYIHMPSTRPWNWKMLTISLG